MRKNTNPRNPQTFVPILLIASGVLLIAVVLIWQFAGAQLGRAEMELPTSTATLTVAEITRTSVEETKKAVDDNLVVIVDVRSREVYEAEHIAGAISIPLDEIENQTGNLQTDQWIITYCT